MMNNKNQKQDQNVNVKANVDEEVEKLLWKEMNMIEK